MMKIQHYFIADLHLGHSNVLRYDNRPFGSIEEHDQYLTSACAVEGRPERTLWLLGDVAYRRENLVEFMKVVKPKWGKVMLIRGNHDDKVAWRFRSMFDESHEARYLRVNPSVKVYMSHYAHRVWRNSHHGSYHLYGHSHGALRPVGRSMDVGAPCIEYRPISLEDCVDKMKMRGSTHHHPKTSDEH